MDPIKVPIIRLFANIHQMFLFRFLYYSSVWGINKDQFDDLLTKYVESMTQQPEVTTYIGEIV